MALSINTKDVLVTVVKAVTFQPFKSGTIRTSIIAFILSSLDLWKSLQLSITGCPGKYGCYALMRSENTKIDNSNDSTKCLMLFGTYNWAWKTLKDPIYRDRYVCQWPAAKACYFSTFITQGKNIYIIHHIPYIQCCYTQHTSGEWEINHGS